ncbi:MAG: electron transporter RnfD [Chitinophagaceae bacterium]|nr:electron transporter RnfD [Chitinophagaceae bacterium]
MLKGFYFFAFGLLLLTVSSCAQNKFVPFNDKNISYEGRVAFSNDAAELMWTGTAVKINFNGTTVSGRFKEADTGNYYNIIIDSKVISKIHFDTALKTYVLVEGLSNGNHTLELFKRTEWDKGKTFFFGFEVDSKTTLLSPTEKPTRKIEFFGNSITCGYATEDYTNDLHVGFFENGYDAYAAITARHFNAQAHYTAKSGIGITISWFPLVMHEMYGRLNPTDANSKWDFSLFTPDVVVINLLQNDYWLLNMPEHEEFKRNFGTKAPDSSYVIGAYENFVQMVRQKYPQAQIVCMLGNMNITERGSAWPGYVQSAVQHLQDKRISTFFVPYKETPGHPKTKEQQQLAEALIKYIDANINW